jgi:hypothetical protein
VVGCSLTSGFVRDVVIGNENDGADLVFPVNVLLGSPSVAGSTYTGPGEDGLPMAFWGRYSESLNRRPLPNPNDGAAL